MKALQYAAIVVVCALAFVGCRSMTRRSLGQQIEDKVISSNVKTRLTVERFGNLFSTGVGTHFGVVSLTGNVPTEEHKAEAARIAGRVAGVKQVNNELVVVPRHAKAAAGGAGTPAASPAAGALSLSGDVTAIDRDSGDVTVRTQSGDVILRLPSGPLREIEQGQRLSISTGQ